MRKLQINNYYHCFHLSNIIFYTLLPPHVTLVYIMQLTPYLASTILAYSVLVVTAPVADTVVTTIATPQSEIIAQAPQKCNAIKPTTGQAKLANYNTKLREIEAATKRAHQCEDMCKDGGWAEADKRKKTQIKSDCIRDYT